MPMASKAMLCCASFGGPDAFEAIAWAWVGVRKGRSFLYTETSEDYQQVVFPLFVMESG